MKRILIDVLVSVFVVQLQSKIDGICHFVREHLNSISMSNTTTLTFARQAIDLFGGLEMRVNTN